MVLVAVQLFVPGLYFPPVFKVECIRIYSTPDDHFTASPHCSVKIPYRGRVDGARGCPTIRAGIISATGVQKAGATEAAPDDHLAACPHCGVIPSGRGRVGATGGRPCIVDASVLARPI